MKLFYTLVCLLTLVTPVQAEKILVLPDDSTIFYTTVFAGDSPRDKSFVATLEASKTFTYLKTRTKYNKLDTSSPIYQQDFAKAIPQLPAIVVQDANGRVVDLQVGVANPSKLTKTISQYCDRHGRCHPNPVLPVPGPPPTPEPAPFVNPSPEPVLPPEPSGPNALVLLALLIGGVGVGLATSFKKEMKE